MRPKRLDPPMPVLLPKGGTVLILGSGPSLLPDDVRLARAHTALTIAVNDSYLYAPDADVLYACDSSWWRRHDYCRVRHVYSNRIFPAFGGPWRVSMSSSAAGGTVNEPDVVVYRQGPQTGLSVDPLKLASGRNSVYQAINLAVHLGATGALLLGVDMQDGKVFRDGHLRPADHFWGHHPDLSKPPYAVCKKQFATLVEPLRRIGFQITNCTPGSALTCFPMRPLPEVCGLEATG